MSLREWALLALAVVGALAYALIAGYTTGLTKRVAAKLRRDDVSLGMHLALGWLWPLTWTLAFVTNLWDLLCWPFRAAYRVGLKDRNR